MNILTKISVLFFLAAMVLQGEAQEVYELTVTIKDADTNKGKMFIAVYNAEKNFLSQSFEGAKSEIANKGCTVTFKDLPKGNYAVSIFHDENDNGKMDTNFLGIPKEDYGCSNDATGFMGPPKWNDAKFQLKEHKTLTITL
ncbi:DUF2141 domain-containing protein [uncultured Winogradskyella sp.]|uniref:DUF2141 domain-containing protein n=1 Tax=uncultured Winogradskyella sp. TaxID=395353 RepID=UPI00261F7438|nr:DUF2141 domain-containing protein [uncultured Winogradskyella sp.]